MTPFRRREALEGYVYLTPWLIGFVAFVAGPILASFYLSFNKYNVILAPEFIGFRNYVTALVALDEESIVKWATTNGISKGYADIVRMPETKALIASYIDELNKSLAKHETVKKFEILPVDLTVDAGELTPSLKVKARSSRKSTRPCSIKCMRHKPS